MKKEFNCSCNKCETNFTPKVKSITANEEQGVKIKCLECPKCGYKYFAGVTDNVYEALLAEYRCRTAAIGKAVKNGATSAVLESLNNKAVKSEKLLNSYYADLREQWKDYFME